MPRSITNGLVILIALVWAANAIIGFFDPARSDTTISGIFLAVITAVYRLGTRNGDHHGAVASARRRLARAIAGPAYPTTPPKGFPEPDQEKGAP